MTMPHPRLMMIPMGCVFGVTKPGGKYRIDVISNPTEIPPNNPVLEDYAAYIFVDDDDGLGPTTEKRYYSFTILDSQIRLRFSKPHFAYKVEMEADAGTTLEPLKPPDYTNELKENYFYFVMGINLSDDDDVRVTSIRKKILKAQERREAASESARKTKSKTGGRPTAKSTKSGKKGSKNSAARGRK